MSRRDLAALLMAGAILGAIVNFGVVAVRAARDQRPALSAPIDRHLEYLDRSGERHRQMIVGLIGLLAARVVAGIISPRRRP